MLRQRPGLFLSVLALVPFAALAAAAAQSDEDAAFVPVTDAMLEDPAPGDWLMWRRTQNGWGYSPLDQVNRDNVGDLQLVWTRALAEGAQEGTPLAYGGVLYMPNPRDHLQAIDAVTGDLLWEYRRDIPEDVPEIMGGLTDNNRNVAIYGRLIIDTSNDDYIYALDATSGELAWETQIFDYQVHPARHSSGPIVGGGRAFSGRSCRPRAGPVSCVIVAHDAATGEELWRTGLVPAPGEPGDETWGGVPYEERMHVGSWMVPSYDPQLDLVYVGTSVTSPAPKFMLGGVDNRHLYHNSTLALDGETGAIRWFYQHLNDHWDLDHPFERILVDTAVAPDPDSVAWINPRLRPGEERRVMTGIPGKTGVVYTLDRETGEFLWATPTIAQNVISDIDGATGAVTENSELIFTDLGQEVLSCPSWGGGKNWPAGRLQPADQHHVLPDAEHLRAGALDDGGRPRHLPPRRPLPARAGNRRPRQRVGDRRRDRRDHLAARAAGLHLRARRDRRRARLRRRRERAIPGVRPGIGEVLWEINLGSAVSGFPITYAVHGRQYVVASTSARRSGLTPELQPSAGNNLFVFALP